MPGPAPPASAGGGVGVVGAEGHAQGRAGGAGVVGNGHLVGEKATLQGGRGARAGTHDQRSPLLSGTNLEKGIKSLKICQYP